MAYLFFSVGLHNPHSHPRTLSGWVTIAKVALLFIRVSPTAGSYTLYYHSMANGWLIPILSGHTFCVTPGGLQGLGLKGGAVPPGVHPAIPPSPLMFPSTIMGTHTRNLPCMCNRGYIPTQGYILTTRCLEGCLLDVVSMRGWAIG